MHIYIYDVFLFTFEERNKSQRHTLQQRNEHRCRFQYLCHFTPTAMKKTKQNLKVAEELLRKRTTGTSLRKGMPPKKCLFFNPQNTRMNYKLMQFCKHSYNHRMQTHIFKDTQCCGLSQQLCSIFCDTLDTGNHRFI